MSSNYTRLAAAATFLGAVVGGLAYAQGSGGSSGAGGSTTGTPSNQPVPPRAVDGANTGNTVSGAAAVRANSGTSSSTTGAATGAASGTTSGTMGSGTAGSSADNNGTSGGNSYGSTGDDMRAPRRDRN